MKLAYLSTLLLFVLSCSDPAPAVVNDGDAPILDELLVIGFAGHRVSNVGEEGVKVEIMLGADVVASGVSNKEGYFVIPVSNEMGVKELTMRIETGRQFWEYLLSREGFIGATNKVDCSLDTNVFYVDLLPEAQLDFGLTLGSDTMGYDMGTVTTFSNKSKVQMQFSPRFPDLKTAQFKIFGNVSDTVYLSFYDSEVSLEEAVRTRKYPVTVAAFSEGTLNIEL